MANFSFGAPATGATPNFSFGSSNTNTGFGASATPAAGTPNFSFAQPQQSNTTATGLGGQSTFGLAGGNTGGLAGLAATSTGFGTFAKPTSTITGIASTAQPLSFASAIGSSQPALNFGGTQSALPTQTTATLPQISTTQATFNFGQTQPSTGLSLTSNPLTSSVGPAFGAFGANSISGISTTSGGGLFGTSSTLPQTTANNFGVTTTGLFGTTSSIPVTQSNIGLGGVDINSSQPKANEGRPDAKTKEAQIPQEIISTIESLKSHIKQQKSLSSDVARTSTRKLFNVSKELENYNWMLVEMLNTVETNYSTIKCLRSDTSDAIQEAEMAQRTQDTPVGLQFENTAPLQYFLRIIQKYESEMLTFRKQVESTEKHMRSLADPQSFTANDLKKGLHQIHESFIALAGRLHESHQKVETQKEQFLNLRKHLLKDKTNIFDLEINQEKSFTTTSSSSSSSAAPSSTSTKYNTISGPTPFSTLLSTNFSLKNSMHNPSWSSSNSQQQQQQQQQQHQQQYSNQNNSLGFGNSSFGQSQPDGIFNLQKPPIGGKRNKH